MSVKYIKNIKDYILRLRRSDFLLLIFIFCIIKALALFLVIEILCTPNKQNGYFPDSHMYETIANNVLAGNGFSLSESPPFKPTMSKEPLYPFFIALIKLLPFYSINFVVFIQILLNPLMAFFIYLIGKEIFTERIARLSALVIALIPIYGEISFFIMPELLFAILLSGTVLCLIKAVKYNHWIWFVLSGLLLGLATLCRNAALPLFIIYPIIILLKTRKNIKKALVLKLTVFILSFFAVTAPWMYRNQIKLGLFSLSRRGGGILSHQAYYAANFSQEEWKAYTLYLLSGRLAQKLYPEIIGSSLGDYEYVYIAQLSYVNGLLEKYPEGEVERIMMREAINNILRHPFKYLSLSAIVYLQTFKYFQSVAMMQIRGPGLFIIGMSLLRAALFIIGIVYAFITFLGILWGRRLFKYQIISATIVYFHIVLTSVGIIPGSLQRHILPITVFYSFFVVIAIDKIIHRRKESLSQ